MSDNTQVYNESKYKKVKLTGLGQRLFTIILDDASGYDEMHKSNLMKPVKIPDLHKNLFQIVFSSPTTNADFHESV